MGRAWALAVLIAISMSAAATTAAWAEPPNDGRKAKAVCSLDLGPKGTVVRIIDGETLALDDGKIVRLIGALSPRARDAGASSGAWPPEVDAIKELSELVLGKKVKLAFGGRHTDRYGQLLAHVFIDDADGDWVQGMLLDAGAARVYVLPENVACTAEMLAHEQAARRHRLSLWNNGIYGARSATRPERLMALRGKYERVIGRVVSVGRTKSAAYLNFGSDYKTDFTARIGKVVRSAHPDFVAGLDALTGKTIVVRGWIDRNNGPMIDIDDPSQIETIDGKDEAVPGSPPVAPEAPPAPPIASEPPAVSGPAKDLRPAPENPKPGAVNL